MHEKCDKTCPNYKVCEQIHKSSCVNCSDSMSKMAEKSCSYGNKDCDFVKTLGEKLAKTAKNKPCKITTGDFSESPCPRCLEKEMFLDRKYISKFKDMIAGVTMVEETKAHCPRCTLEVEQIFKTE